MGSGRPSCGNSGERERRRRAQWPSSTEHAGAAAPAATGAHLAAARGERRERGRWQLGCAEVGVAAARPDGGGRGCGSGARLQRVLERDKRLAQRHLYHGGQGADAGVHGWTERHGGGDLAPAAEDRCARRRCQQTLPLVRQPGGGGGAVHGDASVGSARPGRRHARTTLKRARRAWAHSGRRALGECRQRHARAHEPPACASRQLSTTTCRLRWRRRRRWTACS